MESLRRRKIEWAARRAQKAADKHKEDVNTGSEVEKDAKVKEAPELETNYEMRHQAAHKPGPGTTKHRYEKLSVMTVVHTPLLGPTSVHTPPGGTAVCKKSGAGFKANREDHTEISVQSRKSTNMRTVGALHGSPKLHMI